MSHPYIDLPDRQFWSRGVAALESHLFDPVSAPRFVIRPGDRVATAGSCFAQHISRRLRALGDNFLLAERGEHLSLAEREARQYGLFSARYGNIYTPMQLWQLWQEAFGERQPDERAWRNRQGRWVDPFRPSVEPGGFESIAQLTEDRAAHLAAVRAMFETADYLVFTLGLTEAWRSRVDGSVYPLAPGVAGGEHDPAAHEFVNFSVDETEAALEHVLLAARARNPGLRVILTVSPVPLAATYEPRHVAVSTTYSKAVLRVAAEQLMRHHDWIDYFPSYEVITASPTGGLYFEENWREVSPLGVAHVMRLFTRHYVEGAGAREDELARLGEAALPRSSVICDEEAMDAARTGRG